MEEHEVIDLLRRIDGFYGTKLTHERFGDQNIIKHWVDRLKNIPINHANDIMGTLEEHSLAHKKPSSPSLAVFLAKYKVKYGSDQNNSSMVSYSDSCSFCLNGRVTVVFAGDQISSLHIISAKTGLCKKERNHPKDPSGIYKHYRTERQPCSHCEKGFQVNACFRYDPNYLKYINENSFQNDKGAITWFSGGDFKIPYFVGRTNELEKRV